MHDGEHREPASSNQGRYEPPSGSSIEVVECSPDRLVLFLPAVQGRGRELGCFAIIWLGILSIITLAFGAAILQKPGQVELLPLLFLIPFWLVGLTMLYFCLRMRYLRTIVLIDPQRAVLQETLFGRTKTRECELATGQPAKLVESYRQNDVPVDAVAIPGIPRPLKFGTALTDTEKSWIVATFNDFQGLTPTQADLPEGVSATYVLPDNCQKCGGVLVAPEDPSVLEVNCDFCGTVNQAAVQSSSTAGSDTLAPTGDFPADRVLIVEQTPDRLEFSMRVFENHGMRRGAGCFFAIFAVVWNSIVLTAVISGILGARFNVGSLIMLIFMLPFVGVGLGIASAALFILMGRLQVILDRDQLRARWGLGLLRYTKSFPTESITHVTVDSSPFAARRGQRADPDARLAIVWAGDRWIPISMLQNTNDCRHVALLVRRQLQDMGFQVENHRPRPVTSSPDLDDDDDVDDGEDDEESPSEPETP